MSTVLGLIKTATTAAHDGQKPTKHQQRCGKTNLEILLARFRTTTNEMLNRLAFGPDTAQSLPTRGYYALLRRNIQSESGIDLPKSTLAALIVGVIAILVVFGLSLWLVLRYTFGSDARKRGMQVSDDRDAYRNGKGIEMDVEWKEDVPPPVKTENAPTPTVT
ncbi:hypothetical protein CAC42_2895 [Sphaceloma murrayae]|uniref:Uncharacterized protein n=1 Tax=Sphaceloma murrayae TaxID=2082308 RepID=A0A2K1R0A0_9PEZI|nr:hypothetical protein CAC42_2895 [Sphaceloma murrayae]